MGSAKLKILYVVLFGATCQIGDEILQVSFFSLVFLGFYFYQTLWCQRTTVTI